MPESVSVAVTEDERSILLRAALSDGVLLVSRLTGTTPLIDELVSRGLLDVVTDHEAGEHIVKYVLTESGDAELSGVR